jgi:hypothetical protein
MSEEILMDENFFDRVLDDYYEETAEPLIKLYCRVAEAAGIKQTSWAWRGIVDFQSNHDLIGVKTIRFKSDSDPRLVIDVSTTGTTWLDLWIAADRALVASNEDREVAIEGFSHKSGDSVAVLEVGT